jgi:UDPglucose 6-dehydrogenase
MVEKLVARFGENLSGRRFALWGLAFKPNTDDMREAPSLVIAEQLLARGAQLCAHDPVAMDEARKQLGERIDYAESPEAALQGADALLVVTEWKAFRSPDFDAIKAALKQPLVFDGRNLYEPALMRQLGIEHVSVGRSSSRGSGL